MGHGYRGKVGGFRGYFTDDQVAIMEEMVRDRLSPTFGYDLASGAAPSPMVDRA